MSRGWLVLGAVVGVFAALVIEAVWREPASLVVRHVPVTLLEPHPALDGLRIALLGDLHVGSPFNGLDRLRKIVDRVNAEAPDLVLLAGDYVITNVVGGRVVPPEDIAVELGRLEAPLGVIAVLGNHDGWLDAGRVTRALRNAGITVLRDASTALLHDGLRFGVAGVSDLWTDRHDIEASLAEAVEPTIVLMHHPDLFPEIPSTIPLVLTGHTHGGQVRLPLLGRPVVPSRFGQRYAAGQVEENRHLLYVTTGIGTSILPVRLLVPPEVLILAVSDPPDSTGARP